MGQTFWWPPGSASSGSITANQGTPNNDANAWPVRITDGTHDATVTAGGALNVAISGLANPLPVTDAAAEASLASIDTKLTAPLSVTGPLTDTQLRASAVPVSAASLPLPTGASTSALQTTGNTSLASIDSKLTSPITITGALTDTQLRASPVPISGTVTANAGSGTFAISAASLPLPTGASTAANQATEIASLASIDSKLTSPITVTGPLTDAQLRATPVPVSGTVSTGGLTDTQLRASPVPVSLTSTTITGSVAVTGPLTDTQLRASAVPVSLTSTTITGTVAVSAASLPLPTGAATEATLSAFSNKTASAAVHEAFDYQAITYVGATTDVSTVVFKTGGSGGTTVATLTMGYDGSNRLTSVTKT